MPFKCLGYPFPPPPSSFQLTRSASSWVPRLERMVSLRGLSGFEKNVLLTLIGSVIQPTKVTDMCLCLC